MPVTWKNFAKEEDAILKALLTAAGDIIYASGASTPARLAKGANGEVLTLAAGLPSWAEAAANGKQIATGSYTGNDAADRQITTGFICSLVIIETTAGSGNKDIVVVMIPNMTIFVSSYPGVWDKVSTVYFHASDGFVIGDEGGNVDTKTYYYWAISE